MTKLLRIAPLAVIVFLLSVGTSHADTIVTFTSKGVGDLGSSVETFGVVTANGYYMPTKGAKKGTWQPADLFGRNQSNDHGLGVCDPVEKAANACGSGNGNGDFNEVSNEDRNELIGLTLPKGYQWVSVQLSSLDGNGSSRSSQWERGQLWVDHSSAPNTTIPNVGDSVIWQFSGGGGNPVEPSLTIPSLDRSSPYLFFEPYDWKYKGKNKNNDFLVYDVTIHRASTPEPASLLLLGTGLAGVLAKRRKPTA